MLKTILRLAMCFIMAATGIIARSDDGSRMNGQYWFDFSGEKYAFSPGGNMLISTDGLDEGFHAFHAYVENDGEVSATHTKWFLKTSKRWNENGPLTCTFYVDGRLYETRKLKPGADGSFGVDLDMNDVDLGMHLIGMTLVSEDGLPMGYREGVFMRVPTDLQRSTFNAYYYLDGKYAGAIDVDTDNPIVHLDIDASSLVSGLHSVTLYLASPLGLSTSAKTAWFVRIPEGGEGVKRYSYWFNDNEETLRTVDLKNVSNPFSLVRLIDVPELPFRSRNFTFAVENGAPVMYACNEFNIRFLDPDGRISTGTRTYTDTRVKISPDEISTIAHGKTSVGKIPANVVKFYKFDAEIGDSVCVKLDCAAMLEVFAPDAEPLVKVKGADAVKNNSFVSRQNGTYYLAVHDPVSDTPVSVDFVHIHKFALLEQNVSSTANRGCFEMEVRGNGFESLKSLVLTDGNSELPIRQFRAIDNYNLVAMVDFDDAKAELGEYRLKGYFNDGETDGGEEIISYSILNVENPTQVEIDVEIVPSRVVGTPYLAHINVYNRSNVGVWGVPFNIAAKHPKRGGKIEFMDFGIVVDSNYKDVIPVVHETEDLLNTGSAGSFAQTVIPYLGPGETITYTIGYTTEAHEHVITYAWVSRPWSEDVIDVLSDDYDLSVVEQPFEGNLFTFIECCKLYYQIANNLYDTDTAKSQSVQKRAPVHVQPHEVANAAAGLTKAGVGSAARSANGAISTRMEGRQMLLEMTGSNEYVEQMQQIDSRMLMVGNDLMAAGDTQNNMIGNAESLNHLMNARNHWRESVPSDPAPSPTDVDCYQSGDPNDIKGYLSPSGTNHIAIGVKDIAYAIEFENDPEIANAPASTIYVKSVIDGSGLDLESLRPLKLILGGKETDLPSEHHFVKTMDMRPDINAIAELTFDFDSSSGLAEWKLRSLDPLTLDDIRYMEDGILPVNSSDGIGTGYLTYAVDLKTGLSDGAEIKGSAEIIFDENEPISTPVWTNVTDYVMPEAVIVSQSTTDNVTFRFTVDGSDSGSGIWSYNLYMRPEGSTQWTAVMTQIEDNEFSYTSPHILENATFAVLATDRAGNRQSEASLMILSGDADGNGTIDANDVVVTRNYYLGNTLDINIENADVTGNGKIDVHDATAIINIYLENGVSKTIKQIKLK